MPDPPQALPALVVQPAMARLAARLSITLRELDERCSVEDVLDEIDFGAYLHDVDAEPEQPKAAAPGRLR